MADDAAAPDRKLSEGGRGASDVESTAVELTDSPAGSETSDTETEEHAATSGDADTDFGAEPSAETSEADEAVPAGERAPMSHVKVALIGGTVGVIALAALTGWLGYRTYESNQAEQQRNVFLQAGRQGALNLTTISYETADADVARILDSATGTFYDDFQQRAEPFVQVVNQAQSKSVGTIAEAGLESVRDGEADVLVAVTVQTTNAGTPEQQPRAWRMRISVQDVDGQAKVSNVEFVP